MKKCIAVVGAGFAGAVLAREFAESGLYQVHVFDERDHVAGHCHTSRDGGTGVLVHHFGPHIFHTDRIDVWAYVNRWSRFQSFTNRVKAVTERGIFSLPINLLTINQFFGMNLSPSEARAFLRRKSEDLGRTPANFEEQALHAVGRELYESFFLGYSLKQWGHHPRELPAELFLRIPIRFSYDDAYFTNLYQGIPVDGYTALIERILDHERIVVELQRPFHATEATAFAHCFYSGPLDRYFNYRLGRLDFRTLVYDSFETDDDYQGNAVMNHCTREVPFTRTIEHKHLSPWESHGRSVCTHEYAKATEPGELPSYPVATAESRALQSRYTELARHEDHVTFMGRLGTYRHIDMHSVIGESLDLARYCLRSPPENWPRFTTDLAPSQALPGSAVRAV